MERWVVEPVLAPRACFRTGRGDPGGGPYWQSEFTYRLSPGDPRWDPGRGDQVMTLVVSASAVGDMLGAVGSPWARVSVGEWEAALVELEELRGEVARLMDRVDEAVALDPGSGLDVEGLAGVVAARVVEGLAGSVPVPTGGVEPAAPSSSSRVKRGRS